MADEFNGANGYSSTGSGAGSYNYNQGGYQNGYGSNQTNGNDGGKKKKHGGAGKAVFAVFVAAVFGLCAGAGAWGINRVAGSGQTTEASSDKATLKTDAGSAASSSDSSDAASTGTDSSAAASSSSSLNVSDSKAAVTDVTSVVDKVMPSMVSVYNNFTEKTQDVFGQTYSQQGQATGSGIIISKTDDELLIATNNHVVANNDSLEVQFIDESTASASLKGTDSQSDLAVIAVKLSDIDSSTLDKISVATLGSSDNLQLGQPVVAIGNALGYGQSVTTGVVSALNREIQSEDSETGQQISGKFIQTDAAINPGNSGGALCDLNGNVIGINSSKIGGETVEGMGYAIPISKAEPIIEDLMNQKTKSKVSDDEKGYLGIQGVSVTSQVASAYNMPEGVYVAGIMDGTGAADSDLKKGDIITKIGGTTVSSMDELQRELQYYKGGEKVTLTVQRADNGSYKSQDIDVTLTTKDDFEKAEKKLNKTTGSTSDSGSDSSTEDGAEDNSGSGSNGSGSGSQSGQDSGGFYTFPWGSMFGY